VAKGKIMRVTRVVNSITLQLEYFKSPLNVAESAPKLLEHDERLERLQKSDERLLITRGELFVSGPRVLSLSAVPTNGLF
jgi:hypothetical protein